MKSRVVLCIAALTLGASMSAAAMEVAPPSVDRAAGSKPLPPGGGPNGAEVFKQRCAMCHDPAVERAPNKQQLAQRWPDEIVVALTKGVMRPYAENMSIDEIDAVATFLTGRRPPLEIPPQVDANLCAKGAPFKMRGPSWNGWSPDHRNLRFQPKPGFKAADIPRLKVKWAFTYIGGRYGQPTVVGGRVFASSSSGKVYSLDAKTGCVHWRFDTPAGVRTTLIVGKNPAAPSGYAAYFGSYDRIYYAVDADTGKKIWEMNVEANQRQVLTGSPVLHEDRLIVPISTWEEVTAGATNYECCKARGAIAALDIQTGKIIWKTYMIPEPRPHRVNRLGVQMYGPAGAAIWSTPTIDTKRKLIYVTTGNSFTDVPQDGANAVVALDLNTGAFRWKRQMTQQDNFLGGCPRERTDKALPNCPERNGPDHDFGASAFLLKGPKGKDILVAGQKSSDVYGLNPDTGEIIWQNKLGAGSALGGVEWGMTTDLKRLYVANADIRGGKPGLYALDPITGKTIWATPSPKVSCAWILKPGERRGTACVNSNSQAPTTIPGAIFSGTIDGHLRAYDPETGNIMWDFDTAAHQYETVNGVKDQPGGALDAGGSTVVDGMLYVMSGYNANMGGFPNNVLLAFSVDGK